MPIDVSGLHPLGLVAFRGRLSGLCGRWDREVWGGGGRRRDTGGAGTGPWGACGAGKWLWGACGAGLGPWGGCV